MIPAVEAKPKDISEAAERGDDVSPEAADKQLVPVEKSDPPTFINHLNKAALTTGDLSVLEIEIKPKLLGDFFEAGDFGFIYAERGLGKTWMSMAMANAIAQMEPLGEWKAGSVKNRVLVVDGEMSLSDTQTRINALRMHDDIQWIHNEQLFNTTEKTLNLSDPDQQVALADYCKVQRINCMILDNLSCLFYGIRENDADDWGEYVLPWILRMRRSGVSVVLVAHAGRNGLMRGTSKREDQAHWVLKLEGAPSSAGDDEGATFVSHFTKNRHSPEKNSPALLWEFTPQDDGRPRSTARCIADTRRSRTWWRVA